MSKTKVNKKPVMKLMLKVVEVEATDSQVQAAFKANLVPETVTIWKHNGKLFMKGMNAGNYKTQTVELKIKRHTGTSTKMVSF